MEMVPWKIFTLAHSTIFFVNAIIEQNITLLITASHNNVADFFCLPSYLTSDLVSY